MMKSSINTNDVLKTKTITSPLAVLFRASSSRIAAFITVVLFSFLVNLGLWQLERGEEKQALESQLLLRSQQPPTSLNQIDATSVLTTGVSVLITEAPVPITGVSVPKTEVSVPTTDTTEVPVPVTEVPVPITDVTGLNVAVSVSPTDVPLVYLDNQVYEGRVGYLIYQVVKLVSQDKYLLVELGFIASGYRRDTLPKAPMTLGSTSLTGRLYTRSLNPLSSDLMAESLEHTRIQNLNITQLENELGITLLPFVLQPNNQQNWPLAQPWNPLPMPSKKHFGYALQWFLMAAVWLSLMLTFFIRKWRAITRSRL